MEQVLPGWDADDDPFSDPISESNDLRDASKHEDALKILMSLCESDLRCLDAHAHLGNLVFNRFVKDAIRHFEVGVRIGELSLGEGLDGVLEWGHVDNRPFLPDRRAFRESLSHDLRGILAKRQSSRDARKSVRR
jgi:hypothetical protein